MFLKTRFNEFFCIRLCFTAAPFLTVLMLFDTAILVMSPLLKIYATAEFIDASIRLLSEEAPLTDALSRLRSWSWYRAIPIWEKASVVLSQSG